MAAPSQTAAASRQGGPGTATEPRRARLSRWLLADHTVTDQAPYGASQPAQDGHPWWKVMCLTGVDYFSTLGYQPAIALAAAGAVAPIATLVLVAVTLLGALPVYAVVAKVSHDGAGSIRMLERLLHGWGAKLLVLVLIGFACTDYLITITLSSSDAAAHITSNPYAPTWLGGENLPIALAIVVALAALFLRGFKEAIGLAVVVVLPYLGLNAALVGYCTAHLVTHPDLLDGWLDRLTTAHPEPAGILLMALVVFPRLALGMSGFETGVAVMPQVAGSGPNPLAGRIRGTRKLLTTAALIMSVFLITSSVVVSAMVPEAAVRPGGEADGRALAYLAHELLGNGFGTVYDVVTIVILSLAGASAMAGVLNVIPRYLPRYGMAPSWLEATRPLVLVVLAMAVVIIVAFDADVEAQGGAYATGVLVLMTSAALAVLVLQVRQRKRRLLMYFGVVTAIFAYTTGANMIERPEGLRIALLITAFIILASAASRFSRSYEVRATRVELDVNTRDYLAAVPQPVRILAHKTRETWRPDGHDRLCVGDAWGPRDYDHKIALMRRKQPLAGGRSLVFLEVTVPDGSAFDGVVRVRGEMVGQHFVMRAEGVGIPNVLAAVALAVRDLRQAPPRIYVEWHEGSPVLNVIRFLVLGEGQVGSSTHEILRRAVKDPKKRPVVLVC